MSESNEALVQRIAKAIADRIGNGMSEKYETHAKVAVEFFSALSQQGEAECVCNSVTERGNCSRPCGLSPAPKPQGEPVAWQARFKLLTADGFTQWLQIGEDEYNVALKAGDENIEVRRLYAAPPAPAADELAGLREQLASLEASYKGSEMINDALCRERAALREKLAASEARWKWVSAQFNGMKTSAAERFLEALGIAGDPCETLEHHVDAALSAPSNAAPASDVAPERVSAEDFVEHRHPEYGVGFFCTPDVMDRILATPAAESVPVECRHEPFEGKCIHCNAPFVNGRAAESVAQEGVRSRIQAALANKDHCDKYGWIHLSVDDAKALLSASPSPAADTERDK